MERTIGARADTIIHVAIILPYMAFIFFDRRWINRFENGGLELSLQREWFGFFFFLLLFLMVESVDTTITGNTSGRSCSIHRIAGRWDGDDESQYNLYSFGATIALSLMNNVIALASIQFIQYIYI